MLRVRCYRCGTKAPAVHFGRDHYEIQLHLVPDEQSPRGRTCLPLMPTLKANVLVLSRGTPRLLGRKSQNPKGGR